MALKNLNLMKNGGLINKKSTLKDMGYTRGYKIGNLSADYYRLHQAAKDKTVGSTFPSANIGWSPEFPDIEAIRISDRNRYWDRKMNLRSAGGYRVACHVFAHLSGLEGLHDEYWDKNRQDCANGICRSLGIEPMYPKADTTLEIKDFAPEGSVSRLILTKDVLKAAYEKFPMPEIKKILFSVHELEERPQSIEVVTFDETAESNINKELVLDTNHPIQSLINSFNNRILNLHNDISQDIPDKANYNESGKADEKSENEVFNKCVLEIAQMLKNHPVLHEKKAFKIKYLCVLQLFVQKYSKEDLWANAVLHLYYKNMLDRSSLYNNINFQEWLGDVMSVPANSKEITSYRGWLVADCILMNAYFDESKGEKIVSEIAEVAKGRYKQEVYAICRFLYSGDRSNKNVNIDQYLKDCWNKNRNYQAMKPIKIIVTANMSAGKSTLLNALIGKKVNKTQNDACTAKIHYIMNKPYEDGFCYEWDYLLKLDADDQILMEDNEDNVNDEIAVGTYFQSLASHNKRLWFIDTPGVNSFQDRKHKEVAEKTIHSTDADMMIYVLNGENIGTEDDKKHLLFVLKNYTGRILFLVNKLDRFRSEEDSIPDTINTVIQDLSDMGFKNPEVLPVSAYAAYLAKMKMFKGKLDEDEQDDFELLVRKLRKKEYQFDTYFPESTQKNFRMEYDDDEYQLLYHSGIMHLENIIYNVR